MKMNMNRAMIKAAIAVALKPYEKQDPNVTL
jgi:hypothetical protein